MRNLFITLMVLLSFGWSGTSSVASEVDTKDVLMRLISTINPELEAVERDEIATALLDVAHDKDCKIPWVMLVTVIKRESTFSKDALNTNKDGTEDLGLMQINDANIENLGLDRARLLTDAHYNIKVGCSLLSDNKKAYSKKTPYWIGVYNAGNRLWDPTIVEKVKAYDTMIKAEMVRVTRKLNKLASETSPNGKIIKVN